jgi:hypothetical protein
MKVVGVLLVAALMLGLVLFAIDKANEPGPSAAVKAGVQVGAEPSAPSQAGLVASCDQATRDVTNAEEIYHAQNSRYADILTLLQAGNLATATQFYRVESTDGFVTYRLIGQAGCP